MSLKITEAIAGSIVNPEPVLGNAGENVLPDQLKTEVQNAVYNTVFKPEERVQYLELKKMVDDKVELSDDLKTLWGQLSQKLEDKND